ncbi:MAG: hypothetical protein MJB12_14490 [Firmicutes bacterium]|nr:hypothetical protein [Bacillota bacterium]
MECNIIEIVAVIDEIDTIGTPIISEIAGSQKRVLETMHGLKKQGEINI